MRQGTHIMLEIAGAAVGTYLLWPDAALLLASGKGDEYLTFQQMVAKGGHALPYLSLVLLPLLRFLKKFLGHKFHSAMAVLFFSGLSVVLARSLHPLIMDAYVFIISEHRVWASMAGPATIFVVIAANWAAAFAELYRVTKVAGE
jgi:hypothetical protein